jgi:hypothetical protein
VQTGSDGERPDPAFGQTEIINGRPVRVDFIQHAADRMRERGVTVDDVLLCLRKPDEKRLPTEEGRERWGRYDETGSRRLDVVFKRCDWDTGTPLIVVISVVWGRATRGR